MSVEKLKLEGNEAFKQKKYSQAIELYNKALELNPDAETSSALFSNRSACHFQMKDYPHALEDADNCIRCKPTWEKGYFRRGVALKAMGNMDDARKAIQEYLRLHPGDTTAQDTIAELNNAIRERNNNAKPSLQKNPESARIIGNSLFSEGKYDRAAEFYTRAIELDPTSSPQKANCYANRAACFQQTHMYHDMVSDCNHALEINPSHVKALMRRGIAYEGMEKWKLALADYEAAQRISPGLSAVSQGVLRCQRSIRR